MRLTILGSGTNVHPARAAAGYLVRTDQPILLDFGPRTLANLIKTGINRHAIRYILFSHFHADHFSDFITFFFDAVYYSSAFPLSVTKGTQTGVLDRLAAKGLIQRSTVRGDRRCITVRLTDKGNAL